MPDRHDITGFLEYAKSFTTGIPEIDRNLKLKQDHSLRVLSLTGALCSAEPEAAAVASLAQYTALYHDLSRFEQFQKFRSYNDAESFDHGDRSAEFVQSQNRLAALDAQSQADCLAAIRTHNKAEIPPELNGRARLLAKIVRDADKLDILKILTGHLKNPEANPAIVFSLSPEPRLTPAVRETLLRRQPVRHKDMRTTADFLAGKLQWFDDLNFPWSKQYFLLRGFQKELRHHLPDTEEIRKLFELFYPAAADIR